MFYSRFPLQTLHCQQSSNSDCDTCLQPVTCLFVNVSLISLSVCVCVRVCVRVCACVCEREREGERERLKIL